jgi:hypothetical protein
MNENIYLNVYDYYSINNLTNFLGFGFYHLGIEIYGTEYSFNKEEGIFTVSPKNNKSFPYRETIYLGSTDKSFFEFYKILINLKDDFNTNNFDLLKNNSTHFCNSLSNKFELEIPYKFNRVNDIIPDFFKKKDDSNLEISKIE